MSILLTGCYSGITAGGVAKGFRSTYSPGYYSPQYYYPSLNGYDSRGTAYTFYQTPLGLYGYDSNGNTLTLY